VFLGVAVVDLRSSELKTWPFWRTRARGSAMVCGCGCVFVGDFGIDDCWLERGAIWNATTRLFNAVLAAA